MYITPRTLLGIIRIAQASAKLRFSDVVNEDDIAEAIKLMDCSMKSLMMQDPEMMKRQKKQLNEEDKMSSIMTFIRSFVQDTKSKIYVSDVLKKIKGDARLKFSPNEIEDTLNYYKKLQVINVDSNNQITFL